MMASGEIRPCFPFTSIIVDAAQTLHSPALHDYAQSPQYCENLASHLMALQTLETTLLQETIARMKQLLPPAVNVLYVPGSNIPNGVESFPVIPSPHQDTLSNGTPYINTMPTGTEGSLEMDWLKHNTSTNHDLREEGHRDLVNNTQPRVGLALESRSLDAGEDPKRNTTSDDGLAIDNAAASYPSPKSNSSHTPKVTNSVLKRKVGKLEKSRKRTETQTAKISTNRITVSPSEIPCSSDPSEDGQFSLPDEAVRFNLLRSLAQKPMDDNKLRIIYQTGDKIINDTGVLLNDLEEWLLRDYQTYRVSLPPCHNLPSPEIPATILRFLMETNNDEQRKSVYRRLARVLFFVFIENGVKQLDTRDKNKTIPRRGHHLTTIFHKSILARVGDLGIHGKKCDASQISDSKSYGRRWWQLGSTVGIIAVLTCGAAEASYIDSRRNLHDDSLELLINYMRNAYPNAIAYFQSLDPFIQPLFVNLPISTNQVVDLTGSIDPLYLKFSFPLEIPDRADRNTAMKTAMETATESLLQCFGHCD